jgi:GAF domain-containing protein
MKRRDADANALVEELEAMKTRGAPLAEILDTAVAGLHQGDDRFNWTGIYELDGQTLRLGPFRGTPTEHTEIPVGKGVCGTAVAESRDLNIPDVRATSNYLACSARTRSELVVLIRDGERIFAQIDIDSHRVNAFDLSATRKVEQVAAWLSRAYAETR